MKKILLVENNLLLTMINKRYCELLGYSVVDSVRTGAEAVTAVKTHKPDVIMMDIKIDGDMDGVETMKEIEKFSDVKVIYVTGSSEPGIRERAETTNMLAFCIKPFSYEDLKQIFNSANL